jgi:hypothetical protein
MEQDLTDFFDKPNNELVRSGTTLHPGSKPKNQSALVLSPRARFHEILTVWFEAIRIELHAGGDAHDPAYALQHPCHLTSRPKQL